MCRSGLFLCFIVSVLLSACALNNSSNIKIDGPTANLIVPGQSSALDVERILGPKYLYSFGYRDHPEFNGKRLMIYDAGARMESSIPFAGAKMVQKTLIIVLDDRNMVSDKEMLDEVGGLPPF